MTSEEESQYVKIIDGILKTVDLETVTRKKIRMGLETALGGKDLTDQKVSLVPTTAKRLSSPRAIMGRREVLRHSYYRAIMPSDAYFTSTVILSNPLCTNR